MKNLFREVWNLPEHNEQELDAVVMGSSVKALHKVLELAGDGSKKVSLVVPTDSLVTEPPILTPKFTNYSDFNDNLVSAVTALYKNDNIKVFRNAELVGSPDADIKGANKIRVNVHSYYIDDDKCDNCGECARACPVKVLDLNRAALANSHPIAPSSLVPDESTYAITRLAAPYCQASCPIGMDIRGYIGNISDSNIERSNEVIGLTNPLPLICGKICTHHCEETCARGFLDEPLQIRELKRYAAEHALQALGEVSGAIATGFSDAGDAAKVAVIGSGPAGLAAASELAARGYQITIFEALPLPGGMLRVGIPDFRLAPETVEAELEKIIAHPGIELKLNTPIGEDLTINDLLMKQDFKAVFIGCGAHESVKLRIEGEQSEGVLPGVEFLRRINLGESVKVGSSVMVIGGGNVAVDAARAARRLGAKHVQILYRRTRAEMPAYKEELEQALAEGIELKVLTMPTKVIADGSGHVKALECINMQLGDLDASGRRRPEPVEGTEHTIEADTVIAAVGQAVNLKFLGAGSELALRPNGTFIVEEDTGATNVAGVFAGGDASSGPASVIEAIASGFRAARGIDAYLRTGNESEGRRSADAPPTGYYYHGEHKPTELHMTKLDKHMLKLSAEVEEWKSRKVRAGRHRGGELDPAERVNNFDEVDLPLSEHDAQEEAQRCLSCRLCIGCGICAAVCPRDAVDYNLADRVVELKSENLIKYASPSEGGLPSALAELYKSSYNAVTSMELEAMLNPEGPYQGLILRPFDGEIPGAITFVFLNENPGPKIDVLEGFQALGFMHLVKLVEYIHKHYPEINVKVMTDTIEVGTLPEGYEHLGDGSDAVKALGDTLVHVPDLQVEEDVDAKSFRVTYTDESSVEKSSKSDLIVIGAIFG
ncbi:MAG: FAD-dependent oxidoreductase [Thermoplasmata archaeon]|nr:MAG: FAD-dependent oxidoreductase [Thermoplasmata archaeon]